MAGATPLWPANFSNTKARSTKGWLLFQRARQGLTCPCKPVGHPNEHKRTITPGTLTGLVLQVTVRANMSIDELACTYTAKIERQQRTIHWAISVDPRHK